MDKQLEKMKQEDETISNLNAGFAIAEFVKDKATTMVDKEHCKMMLRSLKSYCLTKEQYKYFNQAVGDLEFERCIDKYLKGDENSNPIVYLAYVVDEFEKAKDDQIKFDL